MAPLVGESNTGCRTMLGDDQKEELSLIWEQLGNGVLPKTGDHWELIEFGMFVGRSSPRRANSNDVDRERVSLLLARKMKNEKTSARKAVDQLYGHIYYLNDPTNLIGDDTLLSWATRRARNHRTPNERLKEEQSSLWALSNSINEDIEFWEKMNGIPINEGLPKGW
jgi:hypothetical protein